MTYGNILILKAHLIQKPLRFVRAEWKRGKCRGRNVEDEEQDDDKDVLSALIVYRVAFRISRVYTILQKAGRRRFISRTHTMYINGSNRASSPLSAWTCCPQASSLGGEQECTWSLRRPVWRCSTRTNPAHCVFNRVAREGSIVPKPKLQSWCVWRTSRRQYHSR